MEWAQKCWLGGYRDGLFGGKKKPGMHSTQRRFSGMQERLNVAEEEGAGRKKE